MLARLVLEDGAVYRGESFGARGEAQGEVVFNTCMSGYEKVVSDPSHLGQIVTMTYPLIGNYGINAGDLASSRPQLRGMVVREVCHRPSNWRSTQSLPDYLQEYGIMGISGVDTRALVRRLRDSGSMMGLLTTGNETDEDLVNRSQKLPAESAVQCGKEMTVPAPVTLHGRGPRVVVFDMGMGETVLRHLQHMGCEVIVVPPHTPAEEINNLRPKGLLFSDGPGTPQSAAAALQVARSLLGCIPMCGIGLGLQAIALALGASVCSLPHGHRGMNHPVRDVDTGAVEITWQNHDHVISENSLQDIPATVTHRHLNDETIEGLAHDSEPVIGVQYRPNPHERPLERTHVLCRFASMMSYVPEEVKCSCAHPTN